MFAWFQVTTYILHISIINSIMQNKVLILINRYFNFFFGIILLFVGLVGIQFYSYNSQNYMAGILPGLAGIGIAQISLGTSSYIFNQKKTDIKMKDVLLTGILILIIGTIFLIIPFVFIGIPLTFPFLGTILVSLGIVILVDSSVSIGFLKPRSVYYYCLFAIIIGFVLLYVCSYGAYLPFIYLGAVPVLSSGLVFFTVLARKKYGKWTTKNMYMVDEFGKDPVK